jgi:hypothetical protein
MAKKRRDKHWEPNYQADRHDRLESAGDPLGKLLQLHRVSLAGVLIVSGTLAVIGLAVLAASALTRQPYSLIFLLAGAFVLLMAAALLGLNVFNVGRRLELRKRGVRFVESGIVAELFWDQIADIEVKRTDDTYLGAVSVRKRSADAVTPSGPLTKTEWHVTIHSHDGRSIRLSPIFMRTIADPRKLISQLRLRAGLP